jgi:hypothetical protein
MPRINLYYNEKREKANLYFLRPLHICTCTHHKLSLFTTGGLVIKTFELRLCLNTESTSALQSSRATNISMLTSHGDELHVGQGCHWRAALEATCCGCCAGMQPARRWFPEGGLPAVFAGACDYCC